MTLSRRQSLAWLAAALGSPAWAVAGTAPDDTVRLAAAWEGDEGHRVGLLSLNAAAAALHIEAALDVPTRAHGLLPEAGGTLLAVARRPGDWLLRWDPAGRVRRMRWIEPLRAFCGHVLASPDGRTLYTTETDLETGAGVLGVRDADSLAKRDEWPTHGIDPHELVWDDRGEGSLIVANGGVPTQPETGRIKRELDRMESSLVRLDRRNGRLLGQWRLQDRRLSLRHLAWSGEQLGIALQAEHDELADKAAAPVLAVFDGEALRTATAPRSLSGYGGSIAATGTGFAVSCPRAGGVALFDADGAWRAWQDLPEACALAQAGGTLWAGGREQVLGLAVSPRLADGARREAALPSSPALRLDNHWARLG